MRGMQVPILIVVFIGLKGQMRRAARVLPIRVEPRRPAGRTARGEIGIVNTHAGECYNAYSKNGDSVPPLEWQDRNRGREFVNAYCVLELRERYWASSLVLPSGWCGDLTMRRFEAPPPPPRCTEQKDHKLPYDTLVPWRVVVLRAWRVVICAQIAGGGGGWQQSASSPLI